MRNTKTSPVTSLTSLKIEAPTTQGTGGFYLAQMTTAQRDALTLIQNGTVIYNLTTRALNAYVGDTLQNGIWTGGGWIALGAAFVPPVGDAGKIVIMGPGNTLVASDIPVANLQP